MALPSTLYRFRIELSDIDRSLYETLDLRIAMHPSEAAAYLLTRVIAYALNFANGLEFSPGGLSDPDEPTLRILDPGSGGYKLCIEIGNPSARKLHRTSKSAQKVVVFTYKDPEALLREVRPAKVHRADEIEIYSLDPRFLTEIEGTLQRDNRWTLIRNEGALSLSVGDRSFEGDLSTHQI